MEHLEQEENTEVTEPVEQLEETQEQSSYSGSDITQLSDEELSQYDSYEDFLQAQQNQQEQVETTESSDDSSGSGQESTVNEEAVRDMTDSEFREYLTSEFRANHKNVTVKDPHDIRKLMQYGMNFHKKMAELAPHRKILKALEQHGLTDESKVNFAIELMQGKPEAIAQLLKQHEVDTYNLPDLEENPYHSANYLPSDERVAFDEVLNDIKQSPYGTEVVNYLSSIDPDSFHQVYANPIMAQNLAIHAETGLMQDALNLLETEKALGKVPADVNDIDAYAFVAKHLEENNPEKYSLNKRSSGSSQPKVVGNNLNRSNQVQAQSNQAKMSANIPTNNQPTQQAQYSGWDVLLNASDEELNKYDNWEAYLQANNLNFQR